MRPPVSDLPLVLENVAYAAGGVAIVRDLGLTIGVGAPTALVGPNGSGKSTLVNYLCGTLANETGTVSFEGHVVNGLPAHARTRLGMARSFQLPRPFVSMSVADNLKVPLLYALGSHARHLTEAEADARCAELLTLVGLVDCAHKYPRDLTQVDMRKLELARAMAA